MIGIVAIAYIGLWRLPTWHFSLVVIGTKLEIPMSNII